MTKPSVNSHRYTTDKHGKKVLKNRPVVQFSQIKYLKTSEIKRLLDNNCIGENGKEYCKETLIDVLNNRSTIEPSEKISVPTLAECFEYCQAEYKKCGLELFKGSVAWLELSNRFASNGVDSAVELARKWAVELAEIIAEDNAIAAEAQAQEQAQWMAEDQAEFEAMQAQLAHDQAQVSQAQAVDLFGAAIPSEAKEQAIDPSEYVQEKIPDQLLETSGLQSIGMAGKKLTQQSIADCDLFGGESILLACPNLIHYNNAMPEIYVSGKKQYKKCRYVSETREALYNYMRDS